LASLLSKKIIKSWHLPILCYNLKWLTGKYVAENLLGGSDFIEIEEENNG